MSDGSYRPTRSHRALLWLALATPAAWMISQLAQGSALALELLQPSGETSVRLTVLALLPGPLSEIAGRYRLLTVWLAFRRNLGVAAFGYALLHLIFYVADSPVFTVMLEELALSGIWTGWAAFGLLLIPASVSFNTARRRLGKRWKRLQQLVYPAFLLSLIHWLLLDWSQLPAALHFAPVLLVWLLRAVIRHNRRLRHRTSP